MFSVGIKYGVRICEHKECVRQLIFPEMATEEGKILMRNDRRYLAGI
jgi:hypothetical protein